MRTLNSVGRLALFAVLFAHAGCNWNDFNNFQDQSSALHIGKPDGYPKSSFGIQLVTYDTPSTSPSASRLIVNSGEGSPAVSYVGWDGMQVVLGGPKEITCGSGSTCPQSTGTAIAGLTTYAGGENCTLTSAPNEAKLEVKCETIEPVYEIGTTVGDHVGASIAALYDAPTIGAAILSAPAAHGGGKLYSLNGTSQALQEIAGFGQATQTAGTLGERLTASRLDSTHVVVAATTRVGSNARIILAVVDSATSAQVRACIDGTGPVFGSSILLRDVGGDAKPELIVSLNDDSAHPDQPTAIDIYPGEGLPTTAMGTAPNFACQAWPVTAGMRPVRVACPTGTAVDCANSGFGSAFAVGDVDVDGRVDLIVGAPTATVAGAVEAGAVFVLPGQATGFPTGAHAVALRHSSPEAHARLGAPVAALSTRLPGATRRSEVVAGAPGTDSVYVFLCSGLPGDDPTVGPRCLPAH